MMKRLHIIILIVVLFTGCDDWKDDYTVFHENNLEEWTPSNVFGLNSTYTPVADKIDRNLSNEQQYVIDLINEYRTGVKECNGKAYLLKELTPGQAITRMSGKLADVMTKGRFILGQKDLSIIEDMRAEAKYFPTRHTGIFSWRDVKEYKNTPISILEDSAYLVKKDCGNFTKSKYKNVGISFSEDLNSRSIAVLYGY